MDVVVLQVFVSLMLAVGSVLLFVHSAKQRDHEHAQRLALLPLEPESTGAEDGASAESDPRGGNRSCESRRADALRARGEKE